MGSGSCPLGLQGIEEEGGSWMCQSLVGWQLLLQVPETGRGQYLEEANTSQSGGGGRWWKACLFSVEPCSAHLPQRRELARGGREGPRSPTQGFLAHGFAQGEEFALGLLPLL